MAGEKEFPTDDEAVFELLMLWDLYASYIVLRHAMDILGILRLLTCVGRLLLRLE